MEASSPAGKVVVRSFPTGNGRRSRAVVEIIDNGSGMSPEFIRESLFQPFATTKPNGVGLGLFTAAQIVRYHGGTMRVLSQPGGGTVVRLGVPRRPSLVTAGRLVIVEDDPELRDQLCWALKKDFEVASAPDAVAGSALCATDPDLYLLDMRLPPSHRVEEGLRLLEEIRGRDPDATVVMMSGEGERSAAVKALQLGAFDFFQKPVDPAELRVILRRALERRRLIVENRALRERAHEQAPFDKLVGNSAPMRKLFRDIQKVAPSDATVLLQGESGTARSSSRTRSTPAARAAPSRSSPSTPRRSPRRWRRRSSSGTRKGRSRGPWPRGPAASSRHTAGRSSSTRSAP